jgi:outer membrane protein OmpA-like peptidoglycan-associated protein
VFILVFLTQGETMKKALCALLLLVLTVFVMPATVHAAYVSRFDALVYDPTVDGGSYFTVYDTATLDAWQGHLGFSLDYANRPLQFSGTGAFVGRRQSVIDHMATLNTFGALGFTDWFNVGLRVPVVLYNWFYSDEPVAAPSGTPDKAAMMGDLEVVMKFRLIDIEKHPVGLAFVPRMTLPSGDVVRYTGTGHFTGGGTLAFEFAPIDKLHFGLNAGAMMRDTVTRHGVTMGPLATYGLGVNYQFHRRWAVIAESFGSTTFDNLFSTRNSPLEAGAGVRHVFGDSGLSLDLAGTAGLIDGVGSPRFRAFATLGWTSGRKEPKPLPDPRIKDNKIILWGKIFFDTDKATIKPVSYPVLDDVVDVLTKHPEITLVEIQGHTDNRASDAYNMKLSQARAESAQNYLVQHGILASRLRAVGFGERLPIASNDNEMGMSQNRRTEFIIISTTDSSIILLDLKVP